MNNLSNFQTDIQENHCFQQQNSFDCSQNLTSSNGKEAFWAPQVNPNYETTQEQNQSDSQQYNQQLDFLISNINQVLLLLKSFFRIWAFDSILSLLSHVIFVAYYYSNKSSFQRYQGSRIENILNEQEDILEEFGYAQALDQMNRGQNLENDVMNKANLYPRYSADILVFIEARTFPNWKAAIDSISDKKQDEIISDLDKKCTYCLEVYSQKSEQILVLPCSHIYHKDCVADWIFKKNSCPICRKDAFDASLKAQYQQEYLLRMTKQEKNE